MKELCFEDQREFKVAHRLSQKTYLYGLSKAKGLEWFRGIVLFGSRQDQYVPYHSSRIELPDETNEGSTAMMNREIVRNLSTRLPAERLVRVDVTYDLQKNDFNAMIGRTAHIQILSDKQSTRMLMCLLMELFVWL